MYREDEKTKELRVKRKARGDKTIGKTLDPMGRSNTGRPDKTWFRPGGQLKPRITEGTLLAKPKSSWDCVATGVRVSVCVVIVEYMHMYVKTH